MELNLDARSKQIIDAAITTGRYGSMEEVVCEGLRLIKARDKYLEAAQDF